MLRNSFDCQFNMNRLTKIRFLYTEGRARKRSYINDGESSPSNINHLLFRYIFSRLTFELRRFNHASTNLAACLWSLSKKNGKLTQHRWCCGTMHYVISLIRKLFFFSLSSNATEYKIRGCVFFFTLFLGKWR